MFVFNEEKNKLPGLSHPELLGIDSPLISPQNVHPSRSWISCMRSWFNRTRCIAIIGCTVLACMVVAAAVLGGLWSFKLKHTFTPANDYYCPAGTDVADAAELSFFVLGDWGRGSDNQKNVAKQMGKVADCYPLSFIVSAGDNFYPHGLSGPNDPLFKSHFTDMYDAPSLQLPWYSVLGNHDYGGESPTSKQSPIYQLSTDSNSANIMSESAASSDTRWNCKQGAWRMSVKAGLVDIIFIDTTALLSKHEEKWSKMPGGVAAQGPAVQLKKIRDLLETSTARFKIVVGHHPIHSYGKHCKDKVTGDCDDMRSILEPLLQQHQVDVYFAGHDHNLQLIRKPIPSHQASTLFAVSGAGSNIRVGELQQVAPDVRNTFWMSEAPGFVAASIKGDTLTLDFWDVRSSSRVFSIKKRANR